MRERSTDAVDDADSGDTVGDVRIPRMQQVHERLHAVCSQR